MNWIFKLPIVKRLKYPALLMLILAAASVSEISACTCYYSSTCTKVQKAEVGFVGVVTSIKQVSKESIFEITFEVEEELKGSPGKSVKIISNFNEGICGYFFRAVGDRYLVFASTGPNFGPGPKGLWTGSCFGNEFLNLKDNKATVEPFRQAARNSHSRIVGLIQERQSALANPVDPSAFQIKADSVGPKLVSYFGNVDKNGEFEIEVPPGTYNVMPILPAGFEWARYRRRSNDGPLELVEGKCTDIAFIFSGPKTSE